MLQKNQRNFRNCFIVLFLKTELTQGLGGKIILYYPPITCVWFQETFEAFVIFAETMQRSVKSFCL